VIPAYTFDGFTCYWQGHLQGPITLCSMGVRELPTKTEIWGVNPATKTSNCLLMIHQGAAPMSDFTFYQITWVKLIVLSVTKCNVGYDKKWLNARDTSFFLRIFDDWQLWPSTFQPNIGHRLLQNHTKLISYWCQLININQAAYKAIMKKHLPQLQRTILCRVWHVAQSLL